MRSMEAIVQANYDGIDGLQIANLANPEKSPVSAIIKTQYTPVLPYDILTEEGKLKGLRPTKLPMIVGYGFGGQVKEVGLLRDSHLVGQNVIGANLGGSNSEIINSSMPPLLFRVPANVSLAAATTIIGGADAALYATQQINATTHETVLITGAAGSVGTYLIQLLTRQAVTVIAVGHSSNHGFLQSVGADYVIDYDQPLVPQLNQVPNVTKVIDSAGSINLLNQLANFYDGLTIFSLSVTDYRPAKPIQRFSFGNGGIGPNDYHQLLTALANGTLTAYIQDQYYFKDVKKAQHALQDQHSQGRMLLTYH